MPLFDVPGWDVPADPVSENRNHSKKRKRRSVDSNDTQGSSFMRIAQVDINFDKIMSKLKGGKAEEEKAEGSTARKESPRKRKVAQEKEKTKEKAKAKDVRGKPISHPMRLQPAGVSHVRKASTDSSHSLPPKKKVKLSPVVETIGSSSPTKADDWEPIQLEDSESSTRLTPLQKSMKQRLDGARFRLINEQLYKSNGREASKMMQDKPSTFIDYHAGFRHQVGSWPSNPVDHYTKIFSQYSAKTLIADLGCGDAALAKALIPQGLNVLSFDLQSDGKYVIEADICNKIPLPGSEPSEGENSEGEASMVDVAVCALSLMSTNWPSCIKEVWRILRPGGEFKVAEVASRFTDTEAFVNVVTVLGFKLQSKDDSNTHFTMFEFTKVARSSKSSKEWSKVLSRGDVLKPCEYKRR